MYVLVIWWAWADILFWASSGLYSGSPTGNEDGDIRNVLPPASPDGDGNMPIKLPMGTKNISFASPNG